MHLSPFNSSLMLSYEMKKMRKEGKVGEGYAGWFMTRMFLFSLPRAFSL